RRSPAPRLVSARRLFDFDDPRARVRQHLRAERAGQHSGKIGNDDSFQHGSRIACALQNWRDRRRRSGEVRTRLLLINPRFPESFWSFRWAIDSVLPNKRTVNPPLGLATVAALSPYDWQIEIIDENIESIPLRPQADIIGVCGMGVQFRRQKELLNYYRGLGYYVVAGGSYASLCPERYGELADTVVAGEAEYIWKEFCRDYEAGSP